MSWTVNCRSMRFLERIVHCTESNFFSHTALSFGRAKRNSKNVYFLIAHPICFLLTSHGESVPYMKCFLLGIIVFGAAGR